MIHCCGEINYHETDPVHIDPEAWMDYWASLKVDAVLVNGGGIMAFYPTRLPYHHRSKFLGSRDVLGEMVVAAKKRGMRAIARMDCNLAYLEALEANPEWFERNRDGSARPYTECPWLYQTCMFSTYFSEQMPAIYREINEHYPIDGFFTNGWPSTAALVVCYCEACQKVFREKVGGSPPHGTFHGEVFYELPGRNRVRRRSEESVVRGVCADLRVVLSVGPGSRLHGGATTLANTSGYSTRAGYGKTVIELTWDDRNDTHGRTLHWGEARNRAQLVTSVLATVLKMY